MRRLFEFDKYFKYEREILIRTEGMKALRDTLGLVDAEKFIMLIKREPFDYTECRYTYGKKSL